MNAGNPQAIKDNGWRQGVIIDNDLAIKLCDLDLIQNFDTQNDIAIVISHSCDVTNPIYKAEPNVELLIAKPTTNRNGNFLHGKNPRKLQVKLENDDSQVFYEVSIHDRIIISRQKLELYSPCHQKTLSDKTIDTMRRWIGARYTRSAFPDEFNNRWKENRDEIESLIKDKGEFLTAIYLSLKPFEELDTDENYQLKIIGVIEDDNFESESASDAYQLMDDMERLFNESTGIIVVDSQLWSESEITLSDLHYLHKWGYDYMSFRDKPGGEIAPER